MCACIWAPIIDSSGFDRAGRGIEGITKMRFGSLFAGIGGIDLGLERSGMACSWQVENNEYAQRVLAKHWPDVPRLGDIRDCGAHNLAPVDVIAGGFPCQDISYAGKGAGITGERSGLWFEYARIIRELRPRYIIVENVAALLDRGMGDVLGTLASFGYDAEWECLPAIAVGAPHIRDRVFIVAYPAKERCDANQILTRECFNRFAETSRGWWSDGHTNRDDGRMRPVPNDIVWGVDYGVPINVDGLGALGNAVVPQVAEFVGRSIIAHNRASRRSREAESARRAKASGAYGEWQMCCLDDFIRGVEKTK